MFEMPFKSETAYVGVSMFYTFSTFSFSVLAFDAQFWSAQRYLGLDHDQ